LSYVTHGVEAGNEKIKQRGMAVRNLRRILLLGKCPSVYLGLGITLTLGVDIPPALRFLGYPRF
jgi:hypothetical protein